MPADGGGATLLLGAPAESLCAPTDGWPGLEKTSFRRAARRSDSDSREALLLSEMPGAAACGVDLVMFSAPRRPAILLRSVARGRPRSEGCGRDCGVLFCVFGENRNVLGANELDRSKLALGAELRGLGVLGVKLGAGLLRPGAGAALGGGVNDGRDGAENDRPEPIEGAGLDGIDRGALKEGLGRLGLTDLGVNDGLGALGRLGLIDGLGVRENDRCVLDMRSAIRPRPALCPTAEEPGVARPKPSDLSRPRSRLSAIGASSMAAIATTTAGALAPPRA